MNPKMRDSDETIHGADGPKLRQKIIFSSILTMTLVGFVVGSISIYFLYQTALDQQKNALIHLASSQARLMEAVALFDKSHSQDVYVEGAVAATLAQFTDAHENFQGLGKTGEFVLGQLEDNKIRFLLRRRHDPGKAAAEISFSSGELAEPMRRALSGESGVMVGPDYRGAEVLAAYEPVKEVNLGIVAKMDTAEVWAPFRGALTLAVVAGIVIIFIGGFIMVRVNDPLIRRICKVHQQH